MVQEAEEFAEEVRLLDWTSYVSRIWCLHFFPLSAVCTHASGARDHVSAEHRVYPHLACPECRCSMAVPPHVLLRVEAEAADDSCHPIICAGQEGQGQD